MESHYILSVDVGTTTIRGHVYNEKAELVGESIRKLDFIVPERGYVEIVPDSLWAQFLTVGAEALTNSKVPASKIDALGISVQRATFTTWNKHTMAHYHNFISWNDTRSAQYTDSVNRAYTFRGLKGGAKILKWITGSRRYEAASVFSFTAQLVIMRLCWVLDNIKGIREDLANGDVLFGTIETWLVWKLTEGKVHATDPSNLSATGLYDLFIANWNSIHMNYLGLPRSLLPEIRDTSGDFGICSEEFFGAAIPIRALVGDQQGALFGQCCFDSGDVKLTLGTGAFMVVNTGKMPSVPARGAYPLVAWRIKGEICYAMECNQSDCGTVVEWGAAMGYYRSPAESEELAKSVDSSGGVYFVPAFKGLLAPVNDLCACACLVGLTPKTRPAHVTRAMLESIMFRCKQLYELQKVVSRVKLNPTIRVNGGASQNNFLLQLAANLLKNPIERATNLDMSCLGAAFLAGLAAGVWKDKEELKRLRKTDVTFQPQPITGEDREFEMWERALQRGAKWYTD
ncbi:glycerol kinase 5-like [Diadema setosum]|uniref:glycerol kinase 5-like n=1 Tax=Diadema setosum TaxID=31175 RepID=UPI003B3B1F84